MSEENSEAQRLFDYSEHVSEFMQHHCTDINDCVTLMAMHMCLVYMSRNKNKKSMLAMMEEAWKQSAEVKREIDKYGEPNEKE